MDALVTGPSSPQVRSAPPPLPPSTSVRPLRLSTAHLPRLPRPAGRHFSAYTSDGVDGKPGVGGLSAPAAALTAPDWSHAPPSPASLVDRRLPETGRCAPVPGRRTREPPQCPSDFEAKSAPFGEKWDFTM